MPVEAPRPITIPSYVPEHYARWVDDCSERLRSRLPFLPPADFAVVLGSGLKNLATVLPLVSSEIIPEEEVGLAKTDKILPGHADKIVAGVTKSGKKVILRSRVIHPYQGNPLGVDTPYGVMSNTQVATGYIHMLDNIGVGNLILSCAVGGVANPAFPGDPPKFPEIPAIGIAGSDFNMAYRSALQGGYMGVGGDVRFPVARESDQDLIEAFQKQLEAHGMPAADENVYCTSLSTSAYENRAQAYFLARNGFEAAGMSLSSEMEAASVAQAIGKILGIEVITNRILLMPKGGNDYMLWLRNKIKERCGFDIPQSEYERDLVAKGRMIIPSRFELGFMGATDTVKESETSHEDVEIMGNRMAIKLQPVVSDLIDVFPN